MSSGGRKRGLAEEFQRGLAVVKPVTNLVVKVVLITEGGATYNIKKSLNGVVPNVIVFGT